MATPDVALISPYPTRGQRHAGPSGVASYACNLARALESEGAGVTVVAPKEPDGDMVERDGNVTVNRSFERGPLALLDAARGARATGAPVAHLQHEMFLYGGPGSIPALGPGLRLLRADSAPVVTAHQVVDPRSIDGGFTDLHRVRVPAPLARAGISSVQRTITRLAARTIVHEPSFATVLDEAEVVPHGVERVAPPERAAARAALGLDDRLCVLCFGYLAPYKGLESALEAARLAGDRVQLVIAGGEHPRLARKDGYARELEDRWGDVARFVGYVDESDVGAWFAAADVALLPYPRPFSSSGALALALAYGTPLLLSDPLVKATNARPELSAPIEPVALAERLRGLARNRDALEPLRAHSAAMAAGRSWSEVARRHLALYEEVTHDAAGPPGR